jgi:riboflavin synthase alpha subunit
LIWHTLSATTLAAKKPGDEVNLEMDPVAKLLRGML